MLELLSGNAAIQYCYIYCNYLLLFIHYYWIYVFSYHHFFVHQKI